VSPDLILQNLLLWSLQIVILSAAALLIRWIAALRAPRAKLTYWQTALAAGLLLPVIRPWKQDFTSDNIEIRSVISGAREAASASTLNLSLPLIAILLLSAGVIARLTWLAFGTWRLSRYRRTSQLMELASGAELRISPDISGPATFGFFQPVVLLPSGFTALDPSVREAILRHELMHVQRRDWLYTLAEESICAFFWFHPAIWWLVSEIRLSREEVVDFEVIAATGQREQYIDALLAVAGAPPAPILSLAPPFLRTNRLKQRIVAILKEVPVSKTKRIFTLAAGFSMLSLSAWIVASALPLHAAPQAQAAPERRPIRVGGAVSQSNLISQVRPAYPPEAKAARIQGTVHLEATISEEGTVVNLVVLSGPDELIESALAAVRQWVYRPTLLNGEPIAVITTIDINYTLQN
jgi:TonB family protein